MGPEAVQGFPDQVLRSLSLHNYSWHSHSRFADSGVFHELAAAHPQPGPAGCSLWSQLLDTRGGGTGHGVTHSEGPTLCRTARAGRGHILIPVNPVTSRHRRGPGVLQSLRLRVFIHPPSHCSAPASPGRAPPSLPPVTPLLSARCQESSKHRLSPPVLLVQASRSRRGAAGRDLAQPAQPLRACICAGATERLSSVPPGRCWGILSREGSPGSWRCHGFPAGKECCAPCCSPSQFLGHSHGLSPPPMGISLAKVDALCRNHSVLTSQGMY